MRRIAATAGGMLALLAVAAAPAAGQSLEDDRDRGRLRHPDRDLRARRRTRGCPPRSGRSARRRRAAGAGARARCAGAEIGLKIVFANFGSPGVSTCRASVGRAQSFVATGPGFATADRARARVSRRRRSRRSTRTTTFEDGAWTLVSAANPYGDGPESPVLRAFAKGGQVASLAGWIGGAGSEAARAAPGR